MSVEKSRWKVLLGFLSLWSASVLAAQPLPAADGRLQSCWFLREGEAVAPSITIASNLRSTTVSDYFRIFYASDDRMFQDVDGNGVPEILEQKRAILERSKYFLQNELGWKLPISRVEMNAPELDVYFVSDGPGWAGTTRRGHVLQVIFNSGTLASRDFPSIWIHQFAHAVELAYRPAGEYWFYEATAAWMEGQFGSFSRNTRRAQRIRLAHPEVSLTDSFPVFALGASHFLGLLSRPYRDVIRQIWDQWSSSRMETVMQVTEKVLSLNHLPNLDSYIQNYFLLFTADTFLEDEQAVILKPFSALVRKGRPEQASGGAKISFVPEGAAVYSASLAYYALGENSGTLAMKEGLSDTWMVMAPYAGMDHFKLVIVNGSPNDLHGILRKNCDTSIPAVLEYFRVNNSDSFVQLEWKTSSENGVAFWNLYRVENGKKERLNSFPIPAAIQSDQGVHYVFLDYSASAFYSLEAITSEGFSSVCANSETAP